MGKDDCVGIGLLGAGTVGSSFLSLVKARQENIRRRFKRGFEVICAAVKNPLKEREESLGISLTDDPLQVVEDERVDVVVELIGGIEPAKSAVLKAISLRKPVISANKDLFALHGPEILSLANQNGVAVLYEAAVGGAVPLVRVLRESLAGEELKRIAGIVNGTTNYVLTRMSEEGCSIEQALEEAKRLGYAEADPRADTSGWDAACKAAIMAQLAFSEALTLQDVYYEGIENLRAEDVAYAHRLGYEVKLLAVVEKDEESGAVSARVHPCFVELSHPLASVKGAFNAVFLEGKAAGEIMLYGHGAGGMPTAAAVLGDVIDAAFKNAEPPLAPLRKELKVVARENLSHSYYLEMDVEDRPGVLAKVADVFGRRGVSIWRMEQDGLGEKARLVFLTHRAREGDVLACLKDLEGLEPVKQVGNLIRILQ